MVGVEPFEITAGRLHLRPWRAGDQSVLLAAGSDPMTLRWTTLPDPYLPEHAEAYVTRTTPQGWASGQDLTWAVCESATGTVWANIALRPVGDPAAEQGVWDVGFWCLASARGQGVVPEALGAVCRWAFAVLGARRIEWAAQVGNGASRRAAEKAGFQAEGVRRAGLVQRGEVVDAWVGALLPGDPQSDTARIPGYADRSDGVVTLRRWRSEDAADVARACDDPDTARWLPVPTPYTAEAGRTFVEEVVPAEWVTGRAAGVAVTDAATGQLLGAVGLTLREDIGEIGYWTAPWARGQGVAVRAARLHSDWALDVLRLPRVELLAEVGNAASQRVAERAGFRQEGLAHAIRPAARSTGRVDMLLFSRTAD